MYLGIKCNFILYWVLNEYGIVPATINSQNMIISALGRWVQIIFGSFVILGVAEDKSSFQFAGFCRRSFFENIQKWSWFKNIRKP